MAKYQFTALDSQGKKQRGSLESESAKAARHQLRQRALTPLTLTEKRASLFVNVRFFSWGAQRLRGAELALITRQLASLVGSGLPLEESILAISEQAERSFIKKLLSAIRCRILEGQSLMQALQDYPAVFPKVYIAAVQAGENSGHLDLILEELANYLEEQQAIRQKIQQALIYPCVVTGISLLIVIFLLTFVVPRMIGVFTSMHQALPMLTVVLLSISQFFQNQGLYCLLFLLCLGAALNYVIKKPEVRISLDRNVLKMPILGKLIILLETGRFSQTLAMLLEAGVPLLEAMRIARGLIQNNALSQAIHQTMTQIREGSSLGQAFKRMGYFPPMSLHLVSSGEGSSQLSSMLRRVAKNHASEVSRAIDLSLTLFEPMMILLMGGVVLFIVLAVLLPIFSMDQMVSMN